MQLLGVPLHRQLRGHHALLVVLAHSMSLDHSCACSQRVDQSWLPGDLNCCSPLCCVDQEHLGSFRLSMPGQRFQKCLGFASELHCRGWIYFDVAGILDSCCNCLDFWTSSSCLLRGLRESNQSYQVWQFQKASHRAFRELVVSQLRLLSPY